MNFNVDSAKKRKFQNKFQEKFRDISQIVNGWTFNSTVSKFTQLATLKDILYHPKSEDEVQIWANLISDTNSILKKSVAEFENDLKANQLL